MELPRSQALLAHFTQTNQIRMWRAPSDLIGLSTSKNVLVTRPHFL